MTTWKDRWKNTATAARPRTDTPAADATQPAARAGDPWLNDGARHDEVNTSSPRAKKRWIGRRKNFLKRA